jgi:hypothetical protein
MEAAINLNTLEYDDSHLVCTPCSSCPNNARVCAPTLALAEAALAEHVAHSHNPEHARWWEVKVGVKVKYKKGNRGRPKGSKNK